MIRFSLDPSSVRATRRLIAEYSRAVNQSKDDSIIDVGREAARQAAQKCPPFGLSEKTGDKFKKSIAKQVNRAVKNANVTGKQGDAAKVHDAARDGKGQVPRGLKEEGQFKRAPVEVADKERVIDKRQAAAGIVKGAWIHAGTLLGRKSAVVTGRKRLAVGRWITRHLSRGKASVVKLGMNTEVTLTNTVGWVQKLQSDSMLASAVRAAWNGKKKEMQKRLDQINR
jgi:hypothetical protein